METSVAVFERNDRQKMARKMRGHKVSIQVTKILCSAIVECESQITITPTHESKKKVNSWQMFINGD